MLVSSFNLSQSFIYTPLLFYKKQFKSEINSFCIWTLYTLTSYNVYENHHILPVLTLCLVSALCQNYAQLLRIQKSVHVL
jgi:hypothetical protein